MFQKLFISLWQECEARPNRLVQLKYTFMPNQAFHITRVCVYFRIHVFSLSAIKSEIYYQLLSITQTFNLNSFRMRKRTSADSPCTSPTSGAVNTPKRPNYQGVLRDEGKLGTLTRSKLSKVWLKSERQVLTWTSITLNTLFLAWREIPRENIKCKAAFLIRQIIREIKT